jgi:predicted homoserine dehydrogenase-like protein
MADHSLGRDVSAGTIISADMVEPPGESLLWSLRREMEECFRLS